MEKFGENKEKRYRWGDIAKCDMVQIPLPSGERLELLKAEDMYFPLELQKGDYVPDLRLNLPRIREMTARPDDILICAYPRSGTHLTFELVNMLMRGQSEYIEEDKDATELELHIPEEFDVLPSPRIFSTHYEFHHIPKEMIIKKCKIIHMQRNPKSVAVSFYFHYKSISDTIKITWEDYLYLFQHECHPFMSWYRSTIGWERVKRERPSLPIFSLYYEELKKDPVAEITKLAKFLEVECDNALIKDISAKYNFKDMRDAKVRLRTKEIMSMPNGVGFVKNKDEWIKAVSNVLYRKGEVNDWKNWFTVAENETFDRIYNEKMNNSDIQKKILFDI